jgi:hypothetical protein
VRSFLEKRKPEFGGLNPENPVVARTQVRKKVGPEVGPTSAIYSCIPTEMHRPTCILWANLTPFLLQKLLGIGKL